MEYTVQRIPMRDLALNTGQVEGLAANPRQWTGEDVRRIAASLRETPELFEMRPIIAVPQGRKYVILAGSLRYCGAKENGDKDAPVIVVPEGTDVRKLQEIVIKDNGSFGAWDMDALANEWDDLPLPEWGVPAWNGEPDVSPDDFGDEFNLPDGDKKTNEITFYFSPEQKSFVEDMLEQVNVQEGETFGNKNKRANAIYTIVKEWAEQRIS